MDQKEKIKCIKILETEVGEITSIEDDKKKHLHPTDDFKDLLQNLDIPQPSQKAELPLNLAAAQDQVCKLVIFSKMLNLNLPFCLSIIF